MIDFRQLMSLRAGGLVKRWHCLPTIGQQTVAEHSAQALTILLILKPDASSELIKAVLWHDSAEQYVGDVPAPSLRASPDFKREYECEEHRFLEEQHPAAYRAVAFLQGEDAYWLKAVDRLDAIMFMVEQRLLGNRHADRIINLSVKWLREDKNTPPEVLEVLDNLEGYYV